MDSAVYEWMQEWVNLTSTVEYKDSFNGVSDKWTVTND